MMTINDINPVLAISDNVILLNSGSIAVAYEIDLPEIFTLSELNYNEIINSLSKVFYTMLPENTVLQFQWVYKKKLFDASKLPDKTFLQKATKRYFNNRYYLDEKLLVFFILPKVAGYKKSYGNFILSKSKKELKLQNEKILKFKNITEKASMVLSSYEYFNVKALSEDYLEKHLKDFFKFGNTFQTDFSLDKSGYRLQEKQIKIFTLSDIENLPDNVKTTFINNERSTDITKFYRPVSSPFGLEFFQDHIVNLVVFYDNQNYWKNKLKSETKRLKASQLFDTDNLINGQANEEFLEIIENESRKIVRFHFSVIIYDSNKSKLKEKENYLIENFNKLGFTPYVPDIDQIYYLLSLFPGNAAELPLDETILSYDEFPFLFFVPEGNYKSDEKGFLFNDRLSQVPIYIDTFDKPYKEKRVDNRNFLVIAPSGGGKSFLTKSNLRQFIEDENIIRYKDNKTGKTKFKKAGTNTVVLNIGGDDKLAKTYKDESLYFEYVPGKPLNVNPFYINKTFLDKDKKDYLIDFITVLWKNGKNLTNDEWSSLDKLIQDFYQVELSNEQLKINLPLDKMNIRNFFEFLNENLEKLKKENSLISFDSLKLNLEKFAIGSYNNLFVTGEPPRMADKKYIEFELDNIKDDPILFPIFGMLIADLIFSTVWKNDGSKKLFFVDEAWKILEHPAMAQLLKYLFKTIRKFTGSVGIAVQQITDIPNTPLGEAILGNTGIKYLLNHSSVLASIPELKKRLGLSQRQVEQLLSLRNNLKGKFPHSEFLLVIGNDSKVLRLEVAPEAYIIYESDKDKLDYFNQLYHKYNDIEKTVLEYKKHYLN